MKHSHQGREHYCGSTHTQEEPRGSTHTTREGALYEALTPRREHYMKHSHPGGSICMKHSHPGGSTI